MGGSMGVALEKDNLLHQDHECDTCGAAWKTLHNELDSICYCTFCGSDNIEEQIVEIELFDADFGAFALEDDDLIET
jgi:hypothetical protein